MSIASEITRINTNISAAYTACSDKGASMPQIQNSANLADTIDSITQGGGAEPEKKDVNFYDYDGVRLYSYTFAQVLALTALPALPAHTGLTAQEWNYTLQQVQSAAQNAYPLNVGATYITSDGSTRLYFYVAKGSKLPNLNLNLCIAGNSSVTVDWGDGTTSVVSNTSSDKMRKVASKSNTSRVNADTILCVRIIGGSFELGYGDGNTTMYGYSPSETYLQYFPLLVKAELGSNCTGITQNAFNRSYNLVAIAIPNSVAKIEYHAFAHCYSLAAVVMPKNVLIKERAFESCLALSRAVLPESSYTNITNGAFTSSYSLTDLVIPPDKESIDATAFSYSLSLAAMVIPPSVTSIKEGAFTYCRRLRLIDLTGYTDPSNLPSLENTSAFSYTSSELRFLVANQQMLDAFSAATNWSSYADKFVTA